MSDFSNGFFGPFIALVSIIGLLATAWLFLKGDGVKTNLNDSVEVTDSGHVWDEDLRELNNPLPRWYLGLFFISLIFGFFYLALYPGLGTFGGLLGVSQKTEFEAEVAAVAEKAAPVFKRYRGMAVEQVAEDAQAREIGQRLFLNNCALCHGSDAGGNKGYPSLSDKDWLWGGEPEAIRTSIADGRNGLMPPFSGILTPEQVEETANYVRSLSNLPSDPIKSQAGSEHFMTYCVACHQAGGTGMAAVGAPNLTDGIWLTSASEKNVRATIREGRNNVMPAHRNLLSADRIHVLTSYVWGLSNL